MIILNPERVTFGARAWNNVSAVTVEREAKTLVAEIGDAGPHVVFADVPEQRCRITVVQELEQTDLHTPTLGELDALKVTTNVSLGDRGRAALSASAVVIDVKVNVARGQGATRRITLLAVSGDGAADPLTTTLAEALE